MNFGAKRSGSASHSHLQSTKRARFLSVHLFVLHLACYQHRMKPLEIHPLNDADPTLYMVGWKEDGIVFYSVGSLFSSRTVMELLYSCQQDPVVNFYKTHTTSSTPLSHTNLHRQHES